MLFGDNVSMIIDRIMEAFQVYQEPSTRIKVRVTTEICI